MEPSGSALVPAASGRVNRLRMLTKVTEARARGSLFIYERVVPPGGGVAVHAHTAEDECAYVLEGSLRYVVGRQSMVAAAGAYVVKPRGVAHGFVNDGPAPARVMEIAVPGHIERFYRELDELLRLAGPDALDDRAAVDALSRRYGIDWTRAG